MDVSDAAGRWNDALQDTFLLWERCKKLHEEAEGATEVRGGPFNVLKHVAAYAAVLERRLREALDAVGTFHHTQAPSTGEDWFKKMDDLLGPDPGP